MKKRMSFCLPVVAMFALSFTTAQANNLFRYLDRSNRLPVISNLPGTDALDADFADVDRDGDLDIFVANGTASPAGRVNRLYINNGSGNFTDETATRIIGGVDANSTEVEFGDVDRDGDLDAVVANLGAEQLLLNNGAGVFTDASVNLPPPAGLDVSAELRLADVDKDGDLDILVANENPFNPASGGQNRIWINNGSGVFTDETAARFPARIDQTQGFAIEDIDRDGDLDAIVVNVGQDFVLINNGTGVFTDQTASRFPVTTDSTRKGVLADLNRDGCVDLIMANSRAQQDRLYFNNCSGVFTDVTADNLPARLDTSNDVDVLDLDNDGDLDLYVSNSGAFQVGHGFLGEQNYYLQNNGSGRFRDRTLLHFPEIEDPTLDAEFGDLDRDGDLDLVTTNASTTNGSVNLFIRRQLF